MMKKNYCSPVLIALCILSFVLIDKKGQAQYFPNYELPLLKGTVPYKMPWVGGLNNPQFSAADLNEDGIKDLVIFDRTGNKLLTFLNGGTPNTVDYSYAPQYEKNFPVMENWCLLLDFNCDGIEDIFTEARPIPSGISVYKGYYNSDSELCFTTYTKLIKFHPTTGSPLNLFVSAVDIPAIVDVDNDNDIDILTFEQSGGYIGMYENFSQQLGYGCDSFYYELSDPCWGDIFEGVQLPKWLNQPCPFRLEGIADNPENNSDNINGSYRGGGTRHTGSCEVAYDSDNDGDKEIIIGDISYDELVFLHNGGNTLNSILAWQDTSYPSYSIPSHISFFPCAYHLDMDNDGKKDLMGAPNSEYGSNVLACSWFYKEIGTDTSILSYQTDSLFTSEMVDLNEGCNPVFTDINNDGLTDILISNRKYFNDYSRISYLENVGSDTVPQFKLITRDWMNLSTLHLQGLYPALGDLDGDGADEMLLGNENGNLLYFENTGGGVSPDNFVLSNPNYFSIDVGSYSTPQIVDVNGDGKLDIVIGEQTGQLNYCRNNGTTTSADFSAVQSSFGNVLVQVSGSSVGFSVPCLVKLNGQTTWTLLVGCESGIIFQYDSIESNIAGTFHLQDSSFADLHPGTFSSISAADINSDGSLELIIGNYRGGCTIYDTSSLHNYGGINSVEEWSVNLFPNPASNYLSILSNKEINHAEVLDLLGRKVEEYSINNSKEFTLNVNQLSSSIYFVRLRSKQNSYSIKFVKL
ncbi:MAG TPA: hypothetical protein DCQ93_04295 [Bacteroidetes bacterium]|nr:hypothetical protein [Bacteroidota bacterium]